MSYVEIADANNFASMWQEMQNKKEALLLETKDELFKETGWGTLKWKENVEETRMPAEKGLKNYMLTFDLMSFSWVLVHPLLCLSQEADGAARGHVAGKTIYDYFTRTMYEVRESESSYVRYVRWEDLNMSVSNGNEYKISWENQSWDVRVDELGAVASAVFRYADSEYRLNVSKWSWIEDSSSNANAVTTNSVGTNNNTTPSVDTATQANAQASVSEGVNVGTNAAAVANVSVNTDELDEQMKTKVNELMDDAKKLIQQGLHNMLQKNEECEPADHLLTVVPACEILSKLADLKKDNAGKTKELVDNFLRGLFDAFGSSATSLENFLNGKITSLDEEKLKGLVDKHPGLFVKLWKPRKIETKKWPRLMNSLDQNGESSGREESAGTIQGLQDELAKLAKEKLDKEAKIRELDAQLQTANTSLSQINQTSNAQEKKISDLKKQIVDLNRQKNAVMTELDEVKKVIAMKEGELKQAREESETLRIEKTGCMENVEKLKAELAELQSKLQEKEQANRELNKEVESLKEKDRTNAQTAEKAVSEKVATLESENIELGKQLAAAQKQRSDDLAEAASKHAANVENLNETIELLKSEKTKALDAQKSTMTYGSHFADLIQRKLRAVIKLVDGLVGKTFELKHIRQFYAYLYVLKVNLEKTQHEYLAQDLLAWMNEFVTITNTSPTRSKPLIENKTLSADQFFDMINKLGKGWVSKTFTKELQQGWEEKVKENINKGIEELEKIKMGASV